MKYQTINDKKQVIKEPIWFSFQKISFSFFFFIFSFFSAKFSPYNHGCWMPRLDLNFQKTYLWKLNKFTKRQLFSLKIRCFFKPILSEKSIFAQLVTTIFLSQLEINHVIYEQTANNCHRCRASLTFLVLLCGKKFYEFARA